MINQEMIFSEERQTWNLFVDGEWYYEGTYEQVEEAMLNNAVCDAEVDDYWENYDEEEEMDYIREGWGEDDDEDPDNFWVSYALQDGTQLGASLHVEDELHPYQEIKRYLLDMHGDDLAEIADYGKY